MTTNLPNLRQQIDEIIAAVKSGERVQIEAAGQPPIEVWMPEHYTVFDKCEIVDQTEGWKRLVEAEKQGIVRLPKGKFDVDAFLAMPKPDLGFSLVEELLKDRRSGR